MASLLIALFALLMSWWSHNHSKRNDRTSIFLGLRSNYREFYSRLHEVFPGLHYLDEYMVPLSWKSCTDKQRALLKEYWIQSFNEWFASNKLSWHFTRFLWRRFYSPVIASGLRHYVLRRGLEEAAKTNYSFGSYDNQFLWAIYLVAQKDIALRSNLWGFNFRCHFFWWHIKNAFFRKRGDLGSAGMLDRKWLHDFRRYYLKLADKKSINESDLIHIDNLFTMLEKLSTRDRERERTGLAGVDEVAAARLIELEGKDILANLPRVENLNPVIGEITLELESLATKIFPQDLKVDYRDFENIEQWVVEWKAEQKRYSEQVDIERAKIWLVCLAALRAIYMGNYGVGAVAFDSKNRPLAIGSNSIVSPRFDSQAHAEMLAMDKLERRVLNRDDIKNHSLITSLEPCPMCFTRLMTSGIRDVFYLGEDEKGGMVKHRNSLPQIWKDFYTGKAYRYIGRTEHADLQKLAMRIFESNRREIDKLLGS